MSIDNPYEITVSAPSQLSDIEAGGTAIVSVPIKVKPDAPAGIYLVTLRFVGFSTESGQPTNAITNSISVPVTVLHPPLFAVTSDKGTISGIDAVTLTLSNNGGPAKNLRLRISDKSGVALYRASEIYIGDLAAQKVVPLTLDARNSSDGPVDVQMSFLYDDELGISHTDNTTLRLTVKNEVLDLRFNQLSTIVTGKDGTLTLEVVNNGDALSDVKLSFYNSTLRMKDKSEINIGDLAAGQRAQVSAEVSNDLTPGTTLIRAKIEWVEKDIRKEQYMDIPISVDSDTDVGVYLEAKPLPLTLGAEHTLSVLVSNLGSHAIENVDVTVSSPALRTLDVSDKQYIGGLQTDDFSTVQFLVRVNATEAGEYPVKFTVNYRDTSGDWKQKVITQTISLQKPEAVSQDPLPLVAGAALLVAGAWFFKFRKGAR